MYQEIIVISLIRHVFSLVVMVQVTGSEILRQNTSSYHTGLILTLFKRLLRLICLRCFSKLLFVFLVLSSLMDLQCWWTAANSKWIEYVSWRGMLSVRIGRNHSKKKWFPPKCYSFSDRRLQYWLGRLNLCSNIVTPFQSIKSNFGNNFLLYNYITEAISSGHTILIVEGKSGFELVNLTWWSAYLELFIVCYDAKLTLAYEQSLFFSK